MGDKVTLKGTFVAPADAAIVVMIEHLERRLHIILKVAAGPGKEVSKQP